MSYKKVRSSPILSLLLLLISLASCRNDSLPTAGVSPTIVNPAAISATPTNTPEALPTEKISTSITSVSPTAVPATETPSLVPTTEPSLLAAALAEISSGSILTYLEALTSIQPYSGWRSSATEGEALALDFISETVVEFDYLRSLGLAIERQSFPVFLATEIWSSEVAITINGEDYDLPAGAIRGHRYNPGQALLFDSDGALDDASPDPIQVEGPPIVFRGAEELFSFEVTELKDKVVLLDYQAIQPGIAPAGESQELLTYLFEADITALLLVTNAAEGSGKYIGGGRAFEDLAVERFPPILYLRLEDLQESGIDRWSDLSTIQTARVTWDEDVLLPGYSGNLVVKIPGQDPTKALVLGAHVDSANTPGAIDNGINSAALLELARILNQVRIQPPFDLYLAWFGSEEIWMYGSQHFVNTQQDVLDRALATITMDAIIASTPGEIFILEESSQGQWGKPGTPFADSLVEIISAVGLPVETVEDNPLIYSDNGVFSGFSVQAGFAFGSEKGKYAHSPYDTYEMVKDQTGLLEKVLSAALAFVLEDEYQHQSWSDLTLPDRQALFVASHTEVMHMTPPSLIALDRAFAWAGYDVDIIEFGRPISEEELAEADVILLLPSIDYRPGAMGAGEASVDWSEAEIAAYGRYVAQGGLLIITNSANQILFETAIDPNEDWEKMNDVAAQFGITFYEGRRPENTAEIVLEHSLTREISTIDLLGDNNVGFTMDNGQVLASVDGVPVVGFVEAGDQGGGVLVLGDVSLLGYSYFAPPRFDNHQFLGNLAEFASDH